MTLLSTNWALMVLMESYGDAGSPVTTGTWLLAPHQVLPGKAA